METNAHGSPKASGNSENFNSDLERHFSIKRQGNVTDRVIETYRGILNHIAPETTFEATIDLLIELGCFSSLKTKNELRVLFDTRLKEVTT